MKNRERSLNAAACINNYTPASFDELVRNNRLFQEQGDDEEMLFVAESIDTGKKVLFSMADVFSGKVTKDMVVGIRLARVSDRNYPRIDSIRCQ